MEEYNGISLTKIRLFYGTLNTRSSPSMRVLVDYPGDGDKVHTISFPLLNRIMLNIKCTDFISYSVVYPMTNCNLLIQHVRLRHLAVLGHTLRVRYDELVKVYALYTPTQAVNILSWLRPPQRKKRSVVTAV